MLSSRPVVTDSCHPATDPIPELRISRVQWPVTVLGPGRRLGVWTQGCDLGCAGCVSQDTWSHEAGRLVSIDELLLALERAIGEDCTGVTISGGEPFAQPEALQMLVGRIRGRWPGIDVFCFSGYSRRWLERHRAAALRGIDAVMAGPYVAERPTDLVWRGSANQELWLLTALGEERLGPYIALERSRPDIQIAVDDQISMIGIPRRGDLATVERDLRAAGITLSDCSWRS